MNTSESYLSYFTPGQMSHETLEFILVKRQRLIERLVDRVQRSVTTAAKHQSILLGPRGMGKSHVVALVYHRVKALPELEGKVAFAWLAEEEWGVASLTDFFLVILKALAREYPDSGLQAEIAALYRLPLDQIEVAASEKIRDFCDDRTLFLMVENLEEIFRGLGEQGQWSFRSFLSERPFVTILATTPSLFAGIQKQEHAFYGFFTPTYLEELTAQEATELLAKVAERRGDKRLTKFLKTRVAHNRVQAVHDLAGGHPRIYLLFAHLITDKALDELITPFLQLLDELTPYYQSRMQLLTPQQRKIIEYLCTCRGAVTVKAIAEGNLLSQQSSAAQLGELERMQYVRKTPVGRESFYELREPLLRIVVEVKRGRGEPIRLIVDFLRRWYSRDERHEHLSFAVSPLSQRYWEASLDLSRALLDTPNLKRAYQLSPGYQKACGDGDFIKAREIAAAIIERKGLKSKPYDWYQYAYCQLMVKDHTGALESLNRIIELDSEESTVWFLRARALENLDHYEEALASSDQGLLLDPQNAMGWIDRGSLLGRMKWYDDSLVSLEKAIKIDPLDFNAWHNIGSVFYESEQYVRAAESYNKALGINSNSASTLFLYGVSLCRIEQYEEALQSFTKCIEIDPTDSDAWSNKGFVLSLLEQHEEALASFSKAIELDADVNIEWLLQGFSLTTTGRLEEALSAYEKALKVNAKNLVAWNFKGSTLYLLKRYDEALKCYESALQIAPDDTSTLFNQSLIFLRNGRWNDFIHNMNRGFVTADKNDDWRGSTLDICLILLARINDEEEYKVTSIVSLYEKYNATQQLCKGLITSIRQLQSSTISQSRAEQWLALWEIAGNAKSEFIVPLRLLKAAVAWKPKHDPRALLALAIEERRVLEQLLNLDTAEAS